MWLFLEAWKTVINPLALLHAYPPGRKLVYYKDQLFSQRKKTACLSLWETHSQKGSFHLCILLILKLTLLPNR